MSDQYRALTRKYRPQSFDEIVSQEHVSSTLKNAIQQNRISHAYMFSGPRGVGKTTMARVLAREVNEIGDEVDRESLNQTLNVIEIDAASNNSVEDIRDLRERVRVPPQNGRYKIYIIDEVHMLSKSAFNAFLKTLEEPPDHVIFIFATTEPNKVLPTILSRVQRFDFKRLKVDEIVSHLKTIAEREQIDVDDDSLHVIAKKADGALRDALGLLDQAISFCGTEIEHEQLLDALNVVSTDRLFQLTDAIEQHDANEGLKLINDLLLEGYDIQEFLTSLLEHLRNLYVAKNTERLYLVEATDTTKQRYREKAGAFSHDDLMRMMHITSKAQDQVKQAQQPRVQFEVALLKLIHMQRSQSLQNLIEGLESLKKNYSQSAGPSHSSANDAHSASADRSSGAAITASNSSNRATQSENTASPSPNEGEEAGSSESFLTNSSGQDSQNRQMSRSNESAADAHPPQPAEEEPEESTTDIPQSDPSKTQKESADSEGKMAPPRTENGVQQYKNHDFFGKSSLNSYQSNLPGEDEPAKNQGTETEDRSPTASPESLDLKDLKESWKKFVNQLGDDFPQMLQLQLERMEPVDMQNRKVLLRCENPFAQKLLQEHRKPITRRFSKFIGTGLQIDSRLEKNNTENNQEQSPYERFRKLQQKDPVIRKIVDMFGAELDY